MSKQYTKQEVNSISKETLISLFLSLQTQVELTNRNLELLTEQIAIMNQQKFGRSSEKIELDGQLNLLF